jgi:uncharacterized coiled-coil protein SlyX
MGSAKSSRAIVGRGTPPGLRPGALSASDVEQMPLEELVDQVIETWRSEAARLQSQIEALQDKVVDLRKVAALVRASHRMHLIRPCCFPRAD